MYVCNNARTDMLSGMNEIALRDLMCQNYHMLFAKSSHNIKSLFGKRFNEDNVFMITKKSS